MNLELLIRYWFLASLLFALLIAYAKPSFGKTGGPLSPEYTIKYFSAFLIFFFTGYSIKTQVCAFFFFFFLLSPQDCVSIIIKGFATSSVKFEASCVDSSLDIYYHANNFFNI